MSAKVTIEFDGKKWEFLNVVFPPLEVAEGTAGIDLEIIPDEPDQFLSIDRLPPPPGPARLDLRIRGYLQLDRPYGISHRVTVPTEQIAG